MTEPPKKRERHPKMVNASLLRAFALHLSKEHRAGKFSRVGSSFIDRCEARLKALVVEEVKRHPSKGKTLL